MRNWATRTAALLILAGTLFILAASSSASSRPPRRVTVMTRNLYLGANLLPIATAAPGAPFQRAVAGALASVRRTGPTARMKLVAQEIAKARPDLVGLQEVSTWSTSRVGGSKVHLIVDYLRVIKAELRRLHAPYRVVAERLSLHLRAPSSTDTEVIFTDGNAILARSDVTVRDAHSGNFQHQLTIPTQGIGKIVVTRSWNALEATVHGAHFHFVNTHLEAYSSATRLQQAQELVKGPLKSARQTILVGDLNSSANLPLAADRPPFLAIRTAGFVDERTSQPNCCLNDDLRTGKWDHIVDHVMARPRAKLVRSYLTGRETTGAGRRPSDHGGVVSVLALAH
ncbi:MAG: endonuclease/exonuclease/phosphatase family protein [Solirubrobacteraceae bacterium]